MIEIKLTLEKAKRQVEEIRATLHDHEATHCKEDQLLLHFAISCSLGHYTKEEAQDVAKEILKTQELDFDRHCA